MKNDPFKNRALIIFEDLIFKILRYKLSLIFLCSYIFVTS